MVRPSWALPLSCVRDPTRNAVCTVRELMGSVTWTAALKTPTVLTLWTQHGQTGQLQHTWELALVGQGVLDDNLSFHLSSVLWFCAFFFFWVWYYLSPIINHPTCTSCRPILVTWLALHLHLWSPGRSSLRTMVRGRMWILLQAVLAQKMKPEQMASQIWDPPFLPGWWIFIPFLADILKCHWREKSCMRTIQCYIFKFECVLLHGVAMLFPHVVVLKGNGRAAQSS